MKKLRQLSYYGWLVWCVAALFYAYEFFLRISPSVMTQELMQAFQVNATVLGILSGAYYYAYASMQLPVGLLLDRFGCRRLLSLAALFVALGCWIFSETHTLWLATCARILMGIGSAFSFIGCLKLIKNWFSPRWLAVVIGLTNTLGVIGAINGEGPLAYFVEHTGWRTVMWTASLVGFFIIFLVRFIIYDNPPHQCLIQEEKPQHFWQGLASVLTSSKTWIIAAIGGLMVAPVSAFTELWSVPFLSLAHHISKEEAATLASFMFIGIAVGGPTHGILSGRLGRRKPVIALGALGALLFLSAALYLPLSQTTLLAADLFFFGFFTSSMLLCFAMNTEQQPRWATGVAVGFTNMMVMLGGTIFQPLIGKLLDLRWQGTMTHGARLFTVNDYRMALSVLPFCLLFTLIILPFLKEGRKEDHRNEG